LDRMAAEVSITKEEVRDRIADDVDVMLDTFDRVFDKYRAESFLANATRMVRTRQYWKDRYTERASRQNAERQGGAAAAAGDSREERGGEDQYCQSRQLRRGGVSDTSKIPAVEGSITLRAEHEIPLATAWIGLKSSKACDDDERLTSIPYFGDNDDDGVNLAVYDLQGILKAPATVDSSREEFSSFSCLSCLLRSPTPPPPAALVEVFGDFISELSIVQTTEACAAIEKRVKEGHPPFASELVLGPPAIMNVQIALTDEERVVFDRWPCYDEKVKARAERMARNWSQCDVSFLTVAELNDIYRRQQGDSFSPLDAPASLFCRRCYKYDCRGHGTLQPKPKYERLDMHVRNVHTMLVNRMSSGGEAWEHVRSTRIWEEEEFDRCLLELERKTVPEGCGQTTVGWVLGLDQKDCQVLEGAVRREWEEGKGKGGVEEVSDVVESASTKCDAPSSRSKTKPKREGACRHWPPHRLRQEQVLLDKTVSVMGREMDVLMKVFPHLTKDELLSLLEGVGSTGQSGSATISQSDSATSHASTRRRRTIRRGQAGISRAGRKKNSNDRLKDIMPCSHDGPCSTATSCSCVESGQQCNKFCACGPTCDRQYKGCRCRKGACNSFSCPCFASRRECDPDLCSCDACEGKHIEDLNCKNCSIRYRKHRRLLLGESGVHGWGVYLSQDVEKGDFLHEYLGELVSQEEADRRGQVYVRNFFDT